MPTWFGNSKSSSPTTKSTKKKGLLGKLSLKNKDEQRRFSLDSDGSGKWSDTKSPTTPCLLPHTPSPPSDLVRFQSLPLPSPTNPPTTSTTEETPFYFGSGSTSSAGSQESSLSAGTGRPSELLFPSLVNTIVDAAPAPPQLQRSGFGNVNGGLSPGCSNVRPLHDLAQSSGLYVSYPLRTCSSSHVDSSDRNGCVDSSARSPQAASAVNQVFGNLFRGQNGSELSPVPSQRRKSPVPSPRIQSPLHPRASVTRSQDSFRLENEAHPLPLPPSATSVMHVVASSSLTVPRSPERPVNLQTGWRKGAVLGSGTFGHVYSGFHSDSGQSCAIKEVLIIRDSGQSMESAKQLKQEVSLLSQMKHPNIVQYYGCEMVEDRLFIYLELMNGSIHNIIQQYGPLSENCIRVYTRQILLGLAYLHGKNTVHRDIKGANILVDKGGEVKLADFGMAKHISDRSFLLSFKGSPYWMAPEVVRNENGYSFAVDIWSLGCTVLEMATGKPPWSQFEGIVAVFKIGSGKDIPDIPEKLSEEAKMFLKSCLQRDPCKRPTASQLLEHPFVRLQRCESGLSDAAFSPSIISHQRMELHSVDVFHNSRVAPRGADRDSSCRARTPKSPRSPRVCDGQVYPPVRTESRRGGSNMTPESSPRWRSSSVWDEAILGYSSREELQNPHRKENLFERTGTHHLSQRFSQDQHQPYFAVPLSPTLVGTASGWEFSGYHVA